jgi:N utilization substance protein B
VLRALLRAAVAELSMADGPPAKVVINEYLDIAHGFLSEEAGKLANGVLNRISRAHRPSEFL